MSELTERDYLALSAVVDSERGLLPFDRVGDIPEDVFMTLRKANLISARLGGYKALEAGRVALKAYRQPLPAQPATEPAETGAGEADAPYTPNDDLNATSLELWTKMFRERIEWKGFYNDHGLNDMMDALDVIATLQAQLTATRARLAAVEAALEPFAEAWLRVSYGVDSLLYIRQVINDGELTALDIGIDTSTLEDAHTAWAGLEPTPTKQASEGEGGK